MKPDSPTISSTQSPPLPAETPAAVKNLIARAANIPKASVGIVGFNRLTVARFNETLIKVGNDNGWRDDQNFPEILAIGTSTISDTNPEFFYDQLKICQDFGCSIIAIPEKVPASFKEDLKLRFKDLEIITLAEDEELDILAAKTLEQSILIKDIKRPNILYSSSKDTEISAAEKEEIENNVRQDAEKRHARILRRKEHGGYPVLKRKLGGNIAAILGGAGNQAGVDLFKRAIEAGIPTILYSASSSPGKHRFEIGEGPSYVPHYRNALSFLTEETLYIKAIMIACNTVHGRLEEYCSPQHQHLIMDIRRSVMTHIAGLGIGSDIVLLGTDATIGKAGREGVYETLRKEEFSSSLPSPFTIPSDEQQEKIIKAIFHVKAGEMKAAEKEITEVVEEIRASIAREKSTPVGEIDSNPMSASQAISSISVILGCTELASAFSDPNSREPNPYRLGELNLINPYIPIISDLVKRLQSTVVKSAINKRARASGSSNNGISSPDEFLTSPSTSPSPAHPTFSEELNIPEGFLGNFYYSGGKYQIRLEKIAASSSIPSTDNMVEKFYDALLNKFRKSEAAQRVNKASNYISFHGRENYEHLKITGTREKADPLLSWILENQKSGKLIEQSKETFQTEVSSKKIRT